MENFENWDKIKERLTALMRQEIVDRCCVSACIVTGQPDPYYLRDNKADSELKKTWTDGEFLLGLYRDAFSRMKFVGDAFPSADINLGASAHAALFKGAKIRFERNSIWFDPSLTDRETQTLEVDDTDAYYNEVINCYRYLTEHTNGGFIIGSPSFSGNADALAHLRGSENLLIDFLSEEDVLQRELELIQTQYERVHSDVFNIVKKNNDGASIIGWMNLWAPGLLQYMQCDLSVMISTEIFNKFIMPELERQTEFLQYSAYHLDGFEQIRHLDSILSLKKLNLIQWTHCDGQPAPYHFMDSLKRIQNAKKSLLIMCSPEDAPIYLENLSSKGLILQLWTDSVEKAENVVKLAEKLTHE
ncbi:MAG: hypothetical protein LBG95_04340 [Treponema sp.]|jgi:hypothetical protein|nr:hypothetical protein [Treponema sp.]